MLPTTLLPATLPSAVNAAKLNALLRKTPSTRVELPAPLAQRDPVAVLVHSFLLWESTSALALEAFHRIQESMVDFNDLRVSLPRELVDVIGSKYPRAEERVRRLRASLNEVFKREHAVRLPAAEGKRDIRTYVETLDGMVVPFVGARVLLQCFGVHGVPVDEQTRAVLAEHELCEAGTELADIAGMLARHVKAEQAEAAHESLQALVDQGHAAEARPARRAAAKDGPRRSRGART